MHVYVHYTYMTMRQRTLVQCFSTFFARDPLPSPSPSCGPWRQQF